MKHQPAVKIEPLASGTESLLTLRWREMDSNFRFRASSDYAGVGVALHLGSLTLRRRGPDWNATKRRRDSEDGIADRREGAFLYFWRSERHLEATIPAP